MPEYLIVIAAGILAGTLSRIVLLRVDYRQYPGYPHSYISHLLLGFIASALGAVAIPAVMAPEYTAVTFLALAAQQFREIRNMERRTLESLERTELVKRGLDYIEGIARTFEARNYLVMATAFATSLVTQFGGLSTGGLMAIIMVLLSRVLMTGDILENICDVVPARLSFQGPILKVDEINMVNVGLKERREKILENGLAVRIKPRDGNARSTIHDMGQRQAIAFTAAVLLGTKKDVNIPEYTPLVRKNPETGEVGLYIMPMEKDLDRLIAAVKLTPVLESASSKPLLAGLPSGKDKKRMD
ncbi:MAG: hypothetical protein GX325_05095 [Peptococcaceae bacterium]|nr:hypothetical protein [Peptococcaceae bacterium]